jgi:hypothetical protein
MEKIYLGDGVYAEMDEFNSIILTTSNGIMDTNRIVLEPEVLDALNKYLQQWFMTRNKKNV